MDIRYQTPEMAAIWSPQARNDLERHLWIRVMRAQVAAGVPIPQEHIDHYVEAAQDIADSENELEQIERIERGTSHDLYARMLYFNRCAGHEDIHLGLTSADITENVQQMQIGRSAGVLLGHAMQLLGRLCGLAQAEAARPIVARTHGQPAQVTTLGKRVLDWACELTSAMESMERAMEAYAPRGIKGAVGTRADLAALLHRYAPDHPDGSALERAEEFDTVLLSTVETDPMESTGQCYPRGADLPIVAAAVQLAAACNTICTNIRLWAVLGHANEARDSQQVGSSAMPHKVNPRFSERVHSLTVVVRGYASMLEQLSGGMWFEGDVSTSAGRRIALPGLFHITDCVLASTAHALDRLEFYRGPIADDVRRHRPLLATGLLLEACVAKGMERSAAHKQIKDHVDWVMALDAPHTLVGRMADDPDLPLAFAEIEDLMQLGRLTEPAEYVVAQALEGLQLEMMEVVEGWPGAML